MAAGTQSIVQTSAASEWLYEDYFTTRTNGSLHGQGAWDAGQGGAVVALDGADKIVYPNNAGANSILTYDMAIDSNQYCEVLYTSEAASNGIGPGVNIQANGTSGHGLYSTPSASYLVRVSGGGEAVLATGDPWSVDDVAALWSHGDTLKVLINGVLDTSIDTDGKYTKTVDDHSNGQAGLVTWGNSASSFITYWRLKVRNE